MQKPLFPMLPSAPSMPRPAGLCLPGAAWRAASLIETLMAMAIVVVAINIMGQLLFQAMGRATMARRRAEATLIAQERLEELLAHRTDLKAWAAKAQETYKPSPLQGMYSFAERKLEPYCWKWDIGEAEGRPGMREVAVVVRWRALGSNWASSVSLRTLLAVPANAAPLPPPSRTEP